MNTVILMGRLGGDPETRHTAGGEQVTGFRLATSERWTDKQGQKQERTEWHSVVVWGGVAGVAEKYLNKGDQVLVQGQLRTQQWDDGGGGKRSKTEVVISGSGGRLELIGGGKGEARTDSGNGRPQQGHSEKYIDPDDLIPF